jgi:type I restriction enzyme S subunit
MSDWIELKIKDLFASSSPGDWGSEGSPETGVPVLRSTNFRNDGSIDFSDIVYRSIDERRLVARRVSAGSILIEKSGGSPTQAAGRVVYCGRDFNGTASNFIEVMKVKPDFDPRYVAYVLYYLYQIGLVLKYQQQTTGIINFKLHEYSEEVIQCASSKLEQETIAGILSTVDLAIEQTEALLAKQQRIKTGLMQDLLTRGIDEHGNLRSESTHKFKDSPLGRIPIEWECEPLFHFVPTAEYGISTSLGDIGEPVIRMNNLVRGDVDVSDLKYTNRPVPDSLWLRWGNVLFNRTNSWEHVGRTGIWRDECDSATFASYLVRLNPDEAILLPELLNIWLNWAKTQIEMRRFATPAVQQVNINPTNLRNMIAAFPSTLDEQAEIVARLNRHGEMLQSTGLLFNKLLSQKMGLMQDLLTGKKRVTPLLEPKLTQ